MIEAKPFRVFNLFCLIGLLIFIFLISLSLTRSSIATSSVTTTIIHSTQADFQSGTVSDTLDINNLPNKISLKGELSEIDLASGSSPLSNTIYSQGSVKLNNGFYYNTDSDPALVDNRVYNSFLDDSNGYLYISTGGGLSVIDTNDNSAVFIYSTDSDPALLSDIVNHSFLDDSSGYLYISTSDGLSVIDTSDNSEVFTYHAGSSPRLYNDQASHSFMDYRGYLYISTYGIGAGLSVIDTNDNIAVFKYNSGSDPVLVGANVYRSFMDYRGYLYINTYGGDGGLSVIDTNDNSAVFRYSTDSDPALASNWIYDSFLDDSNGYLYISTSNGLSVIDTNDNSAVFRYSTDSDPALLSDGVYHSFLDESNGYLYISHYTTTGGLSVIPIDGSYVFSGQRYLTAAPIQDIESGKILLGSETTEDNSVTLQYRTSDGEYWSDWSEECSNSNGCDINPDDLVDQDLIQFRLNLSTEDNFATPLVTSLKTMGNFESSGEYISAVIDSENDNTNWQTLESDSYTPSGTNISFYTRTGNSSIPDSSWSDWQLVNSPIESPDARYLQYKALLTSDLINQTPVLSSVSISYEGDSLSSSQSTSSESSKPETIQIPASSAIALVNQPTKDSNTKGQEVLTVIFPETFGFNAYLSANHNSASHLSNIRQDLINNPSANQSNNLVIAGWLGKELMGFKQDDTIYWQVAGVQQLFYKAYPAPGKEAPIIIPEVQEKPSIIALKYQDSDLIPPGEPTTRFDQNKLKLAHSTDGVNWQVLPSSVVDTDNNTVAAIGKVAGYYVIVGSY